MDRFSVLYNDFLIYLTTTLPSLSSQVEDLNPKPAVALHSFMLYNLPHMEEISTKNVDIFRYKHQKAELVKNIYFKDVIEKLLSLRGGHRALDTIWKKLQTLYIVAYTNCQLRKEAHDYNGENKSIKAQWQTILDNHNVIVENIMLTQCYTGESAHSLEGQQQPQRKSEKSSNTNTNKGQRNGGETLSDEFSHSSDEGGMGDLLGNMMGGLGGLGGMGGLPGMENAEDMFKDTEVGKLAEQLKNDINPEDLKDFNPADMMKMFTGNPGDIQNTGFGKLMMETSKKMVEKMQSGEIDNQKMMSEASQIMGNMFQGQDQGQTGQQPPNPMMNMMQNMMQMMGPTPTPTTKSKPPMPHNRGKGQPRMKKKGKKNMKPNRVAPRPPPKKK